MTTLVLTASPVVVAQEKTRRINDRLSRDWEWLIDPDQRHVLHELVRQGMAGTAHRRGEDGFVLLAWDVAMQRAAAQEAQMARAAEVKTAIDEMPRYASRLYRPPARPVGMRTHAPYAYEPARW